MKLGGKKKISRPTDWPFFSLPGTQETLFYLRVASPFSKLKYNKIIDILLTTKEVSTNLCVKESVCSDLAERQSDCIITSTLSSLFPPI